MNGIVNCAGSILPKPAHLTTEAEWKQTIETNLTTAYATVRAGAKGLWSTGGTIVLGATAEARTGFANHEAIAAAKDGVIGLTLSAAATYAPRNIRVMRCAGPGGYAAGSADHFKRGGYKSFGCNACVGPYRLS